MKPFTTLACLLLAALALLQLTRVLLGWEVILNGTAIPLWPSLLAAALAGTLSVGVWREMRR